MSNRRRRGGVNERDIARLLDVRDNDAADHSGVGSLEYLASFACSGATDIEGGDEWIMATYLNNWVKQRPRHSEAERHSEETKSVLKEQKRLDKAYNAGLAIAPHSQPQLQLEPAAAVPAAAVISVEPATAGDAAMTPAAPPSQPITPVLGIDQGGEWPWFDDWTPYTTQKRDETVSSIVELSKSGKLSLAASCYDALRPHDGRPVLREDWILEINNPHQVLPTPLPNPRPRRRELANRTEQLLAIIAIVKSLQYMSSIHTSRRFRCAWPRH